jgi:hypothetical protein
MTKPNFFIIGGPKCGTTSLSTWLANHPQVFFSPVKEPHFFNFDFGGRRFYTLSKYERLFSKACTEHRAIGEATPNYLYSQAAVPAILKYVKEPRFIVMVRNPVDMAYSLHEQAVFGGYEDEKDFSRAWELQNMRAYGDCLPRSCNDIQKLFYGPRCLMGDQLYRLFKTISREKVLVLNLDHIKQNAKREYQKVLSFLKLDDDGRTEFPVVNMAKERRFPKLYRFIKWTNEMFRSAGVPHIRIGITFFIYNNDRKVRPRPALSKAFRYSLYKYFEDNINLLENLTGWDLNDWKYIQ